MNTRNFLLTVCLTALGLVSVPAVAHGFTIVPRASLTDGEFVDLIKTGKFTESFVAESRIGNNGPGGTQDHEIGLLNPQNNLLPDKKGDRTWVSGQVLDFSLEYNGSLVKYTVGGQLLSSSTFSGAVTDIFLRTRAANGSSMLLSDLKLNGVGFGNLGSVGSGSSDIDYLQVAGLPTAFTLTGKQTMSWTGTRPSRSALAYQIKVGTTPKESVPEPATVGGLAVMGLAAIATRRQQKSK